MSGTGVEGRGRMASDNTTSTPAPLPIVQSRTDREFWLQIRSALLAQVDAIERAFGVKPRTAELRKETRTL
jgi:hypothetical protein